MQARATWVRPILLAILTVAMAVPPGSVAALRQQQPSPPPQQEQKKPEYSITVETPLVNVDAVVTDQDGDILTGLRKQNFRILEDGVPQTLTNFAPTDAPITIVILMEFSKISYYFAENAKYWSYEFLNHLNKDDWVALKTYDLRTRLEEDFTQDKGRVQEAIAHLYFPIFREVAMNDALIETLDELKDVKGKKSILLMASGADTLSKHTLDQTYKRLKQTDVTIFCVGVAEPLYVRGIIDGVGYLQAKNELTTFARETGGYTWFPRLDGELASIFRSVTAFLRNQYSLGYIPSNQAKDGKFRKIKVEIVDDQGQPFVVTNKKGKPRKIVVYAREGYTAAKEAVSD